MNRITQLRKEKGKSQVALAMELNISQKMISAYENGKNEPSIATLKHMADIFNTSIDYLVDYTDIRSPLDKISQRELNADECQLLNIYRSLNQKNQNIALGVLLGLGNANN